MAWGSLMFLWSDGGEREAFSGTGNIAVSLYIVSGSLHIVSLQGPLVALGELDCLHDNCSLQGEIFQQAG